MAKKTKKRKHPEKRNLDRPSLIGNAFWQQRSKHGRDKLFATPELMQDAAFEYFKWTDEHPEYRIEAKVEDGMVINHPVPVRMPYTLEGLCRYINANTHYFRQFKLANTDEGFSLVVRAIEDVIRDQQITGAMTGFFNANLTARINAIKEHTDVTSGDQPLPKVDLHVYNNAPPLAGDEKDVAP